MTTNDPSICTGTIVSPRKMADKKKL